MRFDDRESATAYLRSLGGEMGVIADTGSEILLRTPTKMSMYKHTLEIKAYGKSDIPLEYEDLNKCVYDEQRGIWSLYGRRGGGWILMR